MPTPLEVGATTAGVPRHYAHSYERCRDPHPCPISPIPIKREASTGGATPRQLCRVARGTRPHSYDAGEVVMCGSGEGICCGRGRTAPTVV